MIQKFDYNKSKDEFTKEMLSDTLKFQLPFTPTRGVGGIQNNGKPLGFAADIDITQLANMSGIQLPNIQPINQPQQNLGLFGYTNPLTGSNHIYTREEVGQMSSDEFAKREKEIDAQTRCKITVDLRRKNTHFDNF